jgi:hypothetical protein
VRGEKYTSCPPPTGKRDIHTTGSTGQTKQTHKQRGDKQMEISDSILEGVRCGSKDI